jgi:hypothetical protein
MLRSLVVVFAVLAATPDQGLAEPSGHRGHSSAAAVRSSGSGWRAGNSATGMSSPRFGGHGASGWQQPGWGGTRNPGWGYSFGPSLGGLGR